MPKINLKFADEFAADYDNSVLQNNWIGPEIIFNSCNHLLKINSKILDLGIGTGESAKRLQKKEHEITGLDGSEEMLNRCRQKEIATAHILHNLEEMPFPFQDRLFDAVISNGVFHLIHPLRPVFSEVKRMLKPNGIFAFTYENTDKLTESIEVENGVWEKTSETGVLTFKHNTNYIQNLLSANGFHLLQEKQFLAFSNKKSDTEFYFNVVVARLQ